MERVICLLIGYAFGLIQTGYFVGKHYKTDIREHGSGNAGTTNALRTFGKGAALVTFAGDILKCVLAVVVVRLVFKNSEILPLLSLYGGAGCILGHNFPCYLNFKGGKGVASSLGLVFAIDYRAGIIALLLFIIITAVTRYVSLGSILGYATAVLLLIVFDYQQHFGMTQAARLEMAILLVCLLALACFQHRKNISRLLNGTENKLGKAKV